MQNKGIISSLQVMRRMADFLDYFSAIQDLEGAYGDDQLESHIAAAEHLYTESLEFLKRIPIKKGAEILDVGMGYGLHCRYFARQGLKATGIAMHCPRTLKDKAVREGYKALRMDMHFLDFPDNTFDLLSSLLRGRFEILVCHGHKI